MALKPALGTYSLGRRQALRDAFIIKLCLLLLLLLWQLIHVTSVGQLWTVMGVGRPFRHAASGACTKTLADAVRDDLREDVRRRPSVAAVPDVAIAERRPPLLVASVPQTYGAALTFSAPTLTVPVVVAAALPAASTAATGPIVLPGPSPPERMRLSVITLDRRLATSFPKTDVPDVPSPAPKTFLELP